MADAITGAVDGVAAEGGARLGLVADTHGVVHPALAGILTGVEAILHAGDVGSAAVLDELQTIAPTQAVAGNVDARVADLNLPWQLRYEFHGVRILVTHHTGGTTFLLPPVVRLIEEARPDVVLSGHTHRPALRQEGARFYVNPGSCGPRRFNLPCTCAILTCRPGALAPRVTVQLLDLETGRELDWQAWRTRD